MGGWDLLFSVAQILCASRRAEEMRGHSRPSASGLHQGRVQGPANMPQTPCHTPGGPGPRAALPGPRCQGLRPWGALGWGSASGASSALGPVAPQLPALRSALVPMTLEKHGQQVDTLDQAGGGQGKRRKGAWHPGSPLCTPSTFSGRRKLARLAAPPRECSSGTPIRAPKEGVGPGPPRPAVAEKEGIFCSADLFEGRNAQT